eukprot:3509645-Rhodomonas_salina.1
MAPIAGAVPFFIGMFHMYSIRARPDGEVQVLVLGKEESEQLFAVYPAELQRIRENILNSYGLDLDGHDLSGGQGEEVCTLLGVSVQCLCTALGVCVWRVVLRLGFAFAEGGGARPGGLWRADRGQGDDPVGDSGPHVQTVRRLLQRGGERQRRDGRDVLALGDGSRRDQL